MERIKPTGVYGYLGEHLLRMASKSGTYIYYTENKDLVSTRSLKTCFYVTLSIFASNSLTCQLTMLPCLSLQATCSLVHSLTCLLSMSFKPATMS